MQIDLEWPGLLDSYQLATHLVTPRPIAWVTTQSDNGVVNLAPFSYFGLVADDPILLMLSIGKKTLPDGNVVMKDTARNLLATKEAVVHVVEEALFNAMVDSSASFPPDVSETAKLGLDTDPSVKVCPPRLRAASIAIECRVEQHQEIGSDHNDLFLLRAVHASIADHALMNGRPDPKRLRVIGKIGGPEYVVTSEVKSRTRPK